MKKLTLLASILLFTACAPTPVSGTYLVTTKKNENTCGEAFEFETLESEELNLEIDTENNKVTIEEDLECDLANSTMSCSVLLEEDSGEGYDIDVLQIWEVTWSASDKADGTFGMKLLVFFVFLYLTMELSNSRMRIRELTESIDKWQPKTPKNNDNKVETTSMQNGNDNNENEKKKWQPPAPTRPDHWQRPLLHINSAHRSGDASRQARVVRAAQACRCTLCHGCPQSRISPNPARRRHCHHRARRPYRT